MRTSLSLARTSSREAVALVAVEAQPIWALAAAERNAKVTGETLDFVHHLVLVPRMMRNCDYYTANLCGSLTCQHIQD